MERLSMLTDLMRYRVCGLLFRSIGISDTGLRSLCGDSQSVDRPQMCQVSLFPSCFMPLLLGWQQLTILNNIQNLGIYETVGNCKVRSVVKEMGRGTLLPDPLRGSLWAVLWRWSAFRKVCQQCKGVWQQGKSSSSFGWREGEETLRLLTDSCIPGGLTNSSYILIQQRDWWSTWNEARI